jgi:hypothetical protein
MNKALPVRDVGVIVLSAFVLVQVLDGVLTYVGVTAYGPHLEANPLVRWYVSALGPGPALITVKAFAISCALPLYSCALHGTLTALTALYFAGAIVPWTLALWP